MLKKIVKYGNSCALILDKALLELLNMSEGCIVKLKTDGVSLIITPQAAPVHAAIFPTITPESTFNQAILKVLGQSMGDLEKAENYKTICQELSERYASVVKKNMERAEIRQAVEKIQNRFIKDENNPEYAKELRKVYNQYIPELSELELELSKLAKSYISDFDETKQNLLSSEFAKINEKYRDLFQAVTDLNNNPEYIDKMALLAEKYQLNTDSAQSQEYFKEYIQLISSYLPEYALYQEEMKKTVDLYNRPLHL